MKENIWGYYKQKFFISAFFDWNNHVAHQFERPHWVIQCFERETSCTFTYPNEFRVFSPKKEYWRILMIFILQVLKSCLEFNIKLQAVTLFCISQKHKPKLVSIISETALVFTLKSKYSFKIQSFKVDNFQG